jgi:hypothetical protein
MCINLDVCKSRFRCFTVAYVKFWCCRRMMLGVTNIKIQCCGCWVLLLQTCEEEEEAPDVGCCTQHESLFWWCCNILFPCFICYSNMLRHMHLNVSLWFRKCCGCWVSMLQTCNVGCCVKKEEGGGRAPDVGCCTQHGSQHGRNIVATCGGGGRKTSDVGCCT